MPSELSIGFARIDITPTHPVELCGYGFYLKRVFRRVHDPLHARALVLQCGSDRAAIVSCDLIGLSREVSGQVKEDVGAATGLPPQAVLLHCTHTHSGPATDRALRGCGVGDSRYVRTIAPKLVRVVGRALRDLGPVRETEYAETAIEGIAYNRTYGPQGPLDPMLRSVFFHRPGKPTVALANYGCHPVANGCNDQVSADFPGPLCKGLDARGFDSMFVTGFCGDVDPLGRPRGYANAAAHGRALAAAVRRSARTATEVPIDGLRYGERPLRLPYHVPSSLELLAELRAAKDAMEQDPQNRAHLHAIAWKADALAARQRPGFRRYAETSVQALRLGPLALVAFPGEVFSAFGLRLREQFPDLHLLTVNCANGLVGYIPTPDEFDRKGYAAYTAAGIYDDFQFHPDFGERMCGQAAVLLREVAGKRGGRH